MQAMRSLSCTIALSSVSSRLRSRTTQQPGGVSKAFPSWWKRSAFVEPGVFPFQGDAVDALVGLGELDGALRLIEAIELQGRELDRPRMLAIAARGRGILHAAAGEAHEAASAFASAVAEHRRLELPLERARTLLAQGVALRRARQKRAARESLDEATAVFDTLGARAWAQRARSESARVGGRAPSSAELTPDRTSRRRARGGRTGEQGDRCGAPCDRTDRRNAPDQDLREARHPAPRRARSAHLGLAEADQRSWFSGISLLAAQP